MKQSSAIRCAWLRRASTFCRVRAWKGCIILFCTLAALPVVLWCVVDWSPSAAERYPGGIILRDDAGSVMRVSLGPGDVDCRPFYTADPDDWIVKALVAAEDGSFWRHRGVRPLSVLRAAGQNLLQGRRVSGASTLTMQAVRLIEPHPKSLWWKAKEAVKALKMERAKDKTWILSQYLNRAPFGSNLVGIESAAQGWFGKRAKDLGLGEAALLAGMVQAPSRYRPDRHYDRAVRRRDYVLNRMLELGLITEEQRMGARLVRPELCRSPRPFRCPHYCDWYLRNDAPDACRDVITPLNADIQDLCGRTVGAAAAEGGYEVAAVVLRVATREVVALACSGDYARGRGGMVVTAATPRPAGSTLKPFLSALALDCGAVADDEFLDDSPMSVKGYRPANFDGQYRGPVTLREALVQSLNIPFVRLLQRVSVPVFGDCLRALGFRHLGVPDAESGLGMAIGNVEVSLVELVSAYGVLARNGDDTFSPETCRRLADMLSGDERSRAALGHLADVKTSRFAWKTGTSSAHRDAWTVLWNPEYVVGVWCGHLKGGFGDQTLVGAKAAAPVAWSIARALYPQNDGPWFDPPSVRPATASRRSRAQPRLAILRPEEGATFTLVPGVDGQRILCQATGVSADERLWWYADNRLVGNAIGSGKTAIELPPGDHRLTCTTAAGTSASVRITVKRP